MTEPTHPTPAEIEQQLARILASSSFSNSPRLSGFLAFIVKKALAGEAGQLKGYTIGVEIYGKPADYNPEADSTVRVEAIRLRKTLAHYYHNEGQAEPVLITVAKGSYRPVFGYQRPVAPAPAHIAQRTDTQTRGEAEFQPGQVMTNHTRNYAVTILSITLLLAALGFFVFDRPSEHTQSQSTGRQQIYPVLTVFPFYVDDHVRDHDLLLSLNDQIISKLNLFHTVKVVSANIFKEEKFWETSSLDYARSLKADYVIEGSVRHEENRLIIGVKLLDTEVKTYVWSSEKSYAWEESANTKIVDKISTMIVSQIASPYGALENVHRLKLERNPSKISQNVRCVLDYQAYSNRKNPEDHLKVRTCLESALKADSSYSDGWAALAWIYGDEVRMGYNLIGSADDAKKRALQAAQKATEADPRNPRAHQYMALAAQALGQNHLVRQHTDMALALNPYDSEVVADAAWANCQLGEWERCRELGLQAIEINPLHPDWYNFALFLYHYQKAEYEKSIPYALKYYQPDFLWSNILLAAAYAKSGNKADAQKIANLVQAKFPDFIQNPYEVFKTWGLSEAVIENILSGVTQAGIAIAARK